VEITVLGVLLLVPLTYALLTVFQVQRAAYALTAAARDAGRAFVLADSVSDAQDRAALASAISLEAYGVEPSQVRTAIECPPSGCLAPGAFVTLRWSTSVELPWLPSFGQGSASVPVDVEHRVVVDRFRADPS
jgi:hypothetical protein